MFNSISINCVGTTYETILNNATGYAKATIAVRDTKNEDNLVEFDEWAGDSTYEYIGLSKENAEDVNLMRKIFGVVDYNGDGKLDEKELTALYLYRDATNNGINSDITLDNNINVSDEDMPLAFNMQSLVESDGIKLFNSLYGLFQTEEEKEQLEAKYNEDIASIHESLNGVVENSKQTTLGDCWLLAGLNSLSYTPAGQKIIKDAININGDGTYTVNFLKGDISYTFSDDDLLNARRYGSIDNKDYTSGDYDVLLVELAVEKFLQDCKNGDLVRGVDYPEDAPEFISDNLEYEEINPVNGGDMQDILYLFTGLIPQEISGKYVNYNTTLFYQFNKFPENSWGTVGVRSNLEYFPQDIDGNYVNILNYFSPSNHALSIKGVDSVKDAVILVNPWDSSKEIVMHIDELKKFATKIEICTLPE